MIPELNQIILADCMDIMKNIPDKCFELAIVDPPYGLGKRTTDGGGTNSQIKFMEDIRRSNWDDAAPQKEYFEELKRISKNQIIWGGNYFDLGPCHGFIIWDKEIPDGLSFSDFEFAWTSFRRAARRAKYSAYLDKHGKIHPTQKPVKLYRWILENYAKPGQLILDTHVGSASSLIACESMGFDYVGFEIDPDYYADAKKRMSKGIQGVLL